MDVLTLSIIMAAAYLAVAARLAFFREHPHRLRRGALMLLMLLTTVVVVRAVEIFLFREHVSFWRASTSVLLCVLVFSELARRFRGGQ
ncbi:hypothetical protein [Pseudomonas sp. C9-3]|uniref:hypothetical protein n=1 Tax=Pseudomonas sp. C9-3 TaxID=3078264 RepID=UPI0028E412F4|nr:hypothetical protein [Pseudomonas sp. C9-3]